MPDLNYFNVSLLIGAVVGLLSALLIYYHHSRLPVNRSWFWLNILTVMWSMGYFTLISTDSFSLAEYANRSLHAVAIFIPTLYLQFIAALTRQSAKLKRIIYIAYFIALIFALLTLSGRLLSPVTSKFIFQYVSAAGPLFILYTVNFFFWVIYAEIILIKAWRKASGIYAQQLKYILLTTLLGFSGGSSVFFLTFSAKYPPYPLILFSLYPLIVTFSIIRYRFFDIRTVVFRSLAFSSIILILSVLVGSLSVLLTLLLGAESVVWSSIVPAVIVAAAYRPLSSLVERITNRILYKRSYNPDELLANITAATSSLLSLSQLLSKIAQELTLAFQAGKIGFALINKSGGLEVALRQNFSEEQANKILKYPDTVAVMTRHFETLGSIIAIDELKIRFDNGEYAPAAPELLNLLYEADVALLVALKDKEKLLGAIALGNKKSGDLYTLRDMAILKIIAGHVSIAVNNALLYEEARQFNVTLRREVESATAELEKANTHLRELDQSKSEFLSIAAHQLRTPLTGIKGYVSMFLEGDFGQLAPPQRIELDKIYRASDRLTRLINVFLNVSRIETGRLELTKTPTNFEQIVNDVVGDLTPAYQKKGLQLSLQPPAQPLPLLSLDHDKIQDVVMNLVDNAIKYSPSGSINIRLDRSPSLLTFQIKDMGIGIDAADIDKLFQKFSRADVASHIQTGGSGLGLFVAKKIVEAHGGRIWAESEGKGQGTTFTFTLPIAGELAAASAAR